MPDHRLEISRTRWLVSRAVVVAMPAAYAGTYLTALHAGAPPPTATLLGAAATITVAIVWTIGYRASLRRLVTRTRREQLARSEDQP